MVGIRQSSFSTTCIIFLFTSFLIKYSNGLAYACKPPAEIPESSNDPRLLAPWVASIFKRNEDGIWKYHCGGTLTASYVVITAASCVVSKDLQFHSKYSDMRVAVGLLISDYYAPRDEHSQEAEVALVREHKSPRSLGASSTIKALNTRANLAGILLDRKFNLTAYVYHACLIEASNYIAEALILQEGRQAAVAGFDLNPHSRKNSTRLLENFQFTIQRTIDCVEAYKPREICEFVPGIGVSCNYPAEAGFFNEACGHLTEGTNQTSFPCYFEGAGLIMRSVRHSRVVLNGDFFLMGVYSSNTAVTDEHAHCAQNDTAFFTKHGEYYRWAISHGSGPGFLVCQDGGCFEQSQLCDGVAQCVDKTDESVTVCWNQRNCTKDQFQCTYGACIDDHKVCDGNMDCADNSDESDDKLCQEEDVRRNITCSPIPARQGVKTKCSLPERLGGSVISNCNVRAVPVGTSAHQSCSTYYRGQVKESFKCQRNGNWSNTDFLNCTPDCGISEPPKTAFVIGGANVSTHGEWPWHAAIYMYQNNGAKTLHCGGSLISTKVILTAAHCVTEFGTADLLNITRLVVVFGKLMSAYTDREEKFSQEVPIEKVIVEECYNPNTYESDIALIILKWAVKITGSVRPVCFSEDEDLAKEQFNNTLGNGTQLGTTVGFGLDETRMVSVNLKILKMPVIAKATCEAALPKSHREIRYTWICGGYTNGSAVCQGHSGGGFVFPKDDSYSGSRRYYVQGIVSHGPTTKNKNEDPCGKNFYKVFTKVTPFAQWIRKTIDEVETQVIIEADNNKSKNVTNGIRIG